MALCCLLPLRYLSPPPDPSPGDTITDCPLYHVISIFIIHTQPKHFPFPNLQLSIYQIDERIDTFPNLITTLSVIHLTSKLSVIHTKPYSSPNSQLVKSLTSMKNNNGRKPGTSTTLFSEHIAFILPKSSHFVFHVFTQVIVDSKNRIEMEFSKRESMTSQSAAFGDKPTAGSQTTCFT